MDARTRWFACTAALCILLAPAESRGEAGPLAVSLEYAAVSECPVASDFRAIVTDRLGYDAFREDAVERVLVQIASRPPAFEGRIEWRDAEGRWAGDRTFPSRSDDCRELARAMAFALALQIQLSATANTHQVTGSPGAEEGSPSAEAPLSTPPTPVPASPPAGARQDLPAAGELTGSPSRGTAFAIGAGGLAGFGVASKAVPFGRVFGAVAWPHWSLELAAEMGLPTQERRADGAGFSQQAFLLSGAGCSVVTRWSACLLIKGGALRIAGDRIDEPVLQWGPLVETGLRLAVTQPLGRRVFVAARAEGLVIVTRWQVTLDQTTVWTSSRFTETLGLDLGLRFP